MAFRFDTDPEKKEYRKRHRLSDRLLVAPVHLFGLSVRVERVVDHALWDAWVHERDIAIPGSALRRVRQKRFIAYDSCDFDEPIRALHDMKLLGEGQ